MSGLPGLITSIIEYLPQIPNLIHNLFLEWFNTLIELFHNICDFIPKLPQLFWDMMCASFETVIHLVNSIIDLIPQLPAFVYACFKTWCDTALGVFNSILDFIPQIPGIIWDFFKFGFDAVTTVVTSVWDAVLSVPLSIFNYIKQVFVPDTDGINTSINSLKNTFTSTFGLDGYDISGAMGTNGSIVNIQGTVDVAGHSVSSTFFDSTFLTKGINTFRPYIRGFIVLLLVLYNINQFSQFIGSGFITLGSNIGTSLQGHKEEDPFKIWFNGLKNK